jgi:hypothetical protein
MKALGVARDSTRWRRKPGARTTLIKPPLVVWATEPRDLRPSWGSINMCVTTQSINSNTMRHRFYSMRLNI